MRKEANITGQTAVTAAASFIPLTASAHAGMADRWIQADVSITATCATVLAVQLVLGITAIVLDRKGSRISGLFMKAADTLHENFYMRILSVWLLTGFVSAPFLALVDHALFFAGMITVLFSLVCCILSAFSRIRRKVSSRKSICIMLHIAVHQLAGYLAYWALWGTSLIQGTFSRPDECYMPDGGKAWFPEHYEGIDYCLGNALLVLALTALPYVVTAVTTAVRRHKKMSGEQSGEYPVR